MTTDRPGPHLARGVAAGAVLVVVATAVMVPFHRDLSRATPALVLIVPVIVAAILGGTAAAVVVAVGGDLAYSLGFVPPVGHLGAALPEDAVGLAVFLAAGIVAGSLTAREADRRRAAEARSRELSAMHRQLEAVTAERERLAAEHHRLLLLRQVDEARSALLRSVSHDLRTPLAAIRAIATDLRAGVAYDEQTRNELLGIVGDQAARLDRLVANLLSMSRIEAGALRLDREAIDAGVMLAELVRSLSALYREARIDLDVDEDLPAVWADWVQIEQVLVNLVDNALRHGPPAGPVRLEARATAGALELSVTDAGPGIDPAQAAGLWEPFRAGAQSRSTGLGLAICRTVVEAHGGAIRIERADGGGTSVALTLPWATTAPEVPEEADARR